MKPAHAVLLQLVGLILQNLVLLGSGMYVARTIGAHDYGITNLLRALVQTVILLAPIGLDVYMQKYIGGAPAGREAHTRAVAFRLRAIVAAIGMSVVALLAAGGASLVNARLYKVEGLEQLLVLSFAALPFMADVALMAGVYRGRNNPAPQIIVSLYVLPLTRLAMLYAVLESGWGLHGVIYCNLASALLSFGLLLAHYLTVQRRCDTTGAPAGTVPWSEVTAVLRPSSWVALSIFLYAGIRAMDLVLLGGMVSMKEVGEYAAMSTIAQFIQFFPNSIGLTLPARVAQAHAQGDSASIAEQIVRNNRNSILMAAPIFAGVAIWGRDLDLLFGASFNFTPAVAFWLALGYFVSGATGSSGLALSMTGRTKTETLILAVGACVAVGLCLILGQWQGAIGVATAVCVSYIFTNSLRTWVGTHVLRHGLLNARDFLAPLLLLPLAWAVHAAASLTLPRSLLTLLGSTGSFLALAAIVYWLVVLSESERAAVRCRLPAWLPLGQRRDHS